MSIKHTKYPKIPNQHKLLKEMVFMGLNEATFYSTIKLHGMNAAIVIYPDGQTYHIQSRNLVLKGVDGPLKGFGNYVESNKRLFLNLRTQFSSLLKPDSPILFFGEWCGQGIQSKVAVCKLSKRFVLFDVLVSDNKWLTREALLSIEENHDAEFYNIHQYESKNITVHVDENTEETQNELRTITDAYEAQCPYSLANGVSGKGEGLVWTCEYNINGSVCDRLKFKTKGSSNACVKGVDYSLSCDEFESIKKAVEFCITENRVKQGVSELGLKWGDKKNASKLIKWVIDDSLSEEKDIIHNVTGFKKNAGAEVMKHYCKLSI